MSEQDSFRRFTFENIGVRGEWVHLDANWQSVLERHPYPPVVAKQLGQALAAVVLLSATIKFEGSLILQVQGQGPLHTLVAQCTHERTIRGLAQWGAEVPDASLAEVFGPGRLVLTVKQEGAEPYQGIVGLEGDSLAHALQSYFSQSEQLATRLWLAADGKRVAGLFIQELPSQHGSRDDWNRIALLADTVSECELLQLPGEALLYRLFHEEEVRLYPPEPVAFRCGCSRDKISSVLRGLGREELEAILSEQGKIEVNCEFCNLHYLFDAVDVHALLADSVVLAPNARH
ncbi:Hsp33 family molecular chaperone HslO [Methylococcus sp. EFPC2]|uniref:Hsp33 family molecular chaperone HslO n=1 Tax=Methylococcus sp. EFPC2 TaxID=2812648 RepID=UPI001968A172|nr:Hsp33 family molecular chaperone HslO [Methylococcus sp. EFPC2]QSA96233.1 Hsp33 family molecular chaperone HslO [Methylococcus sp. EFPC2]